MPSLYFPLWKAVGLTEDATTHEIIDVLNSSCLEGTRVYKIGCNRGWEDVCKCRQTSTDQSATQYL